LTAPLPRDIYAGPIIINYQPYLHTRPGVPWPGIHLSITGYCSWLEFIENSVYWNTNTTRTQLKLWWCPGILYIVRG